MPAQASASYRIGDGELFPRASYTGVYDDNITYSALNEIDDFVNQFSLGGDWELEGKNRLLTFSGDLRQDVFIDNSDFNNTSGEFIADYRMEFSEHRRLFLSDRFSHSEEPRSFEDAFGRTSGRYRYLSNTASVSYEHDFSSHWSARGFYTNHINDASTDLVRDSLLHDTGFDVIRIFSTQLSFLAGYEFLNRSFDNGPDAYTHSAAIGARYAITQTLTFDGRAGVDFIESFTGRDSEKPTLSASLTQEWDELSSFSLRFSKRFDTTTYSTDLFDQWRVSGAYQRELSRRWSMNLNAFFGQGEYVSAGRTDDLYGAGGSVGYDLNENARLSVGYRYSETDSTFNTSDYVKNTVTASVKYQF